MNGSERSRRQDFPLDAARDTGSAVVAAASALMSEPIPAALEDPADAETVDGHLAILGGLLRERLLTAGPDQDWTQLANISATLADLHSARYRINDLLLRERLRRFEVLDGELTRLRLVHDPQELLKRVCESVLAGCEFDRVLLSQVDGSTWKPWRSRSVVHGSAEEAFGDWIAGSPQIRLEHLLLESDMIRRREPSIVFPGTDGRRISSSFAEARGLTSYVAVPLFPGADVIGFLHADYHDRDVSGLDLDVLAAYGRGFDSIYERAVLVQRLDEQRRQIRQTMQSVDTVLDELATAEIAFAARPVDPSRRSTGQVPSALGPNALDTLLTKREQEVLALMATGGTNARIAEKLVITPDTVKSHVQRILRKLRVDNRAEAVSKYLRLTLGRNNS